MAHVVSRDADVVLDGVDHFLSTRVNDPVVDVSTLQSIPAEQAVHRCLCVDAEDVGYVTVEIEREFPVLRRPVVAHRSPRIRDDVAVEVFDGWHERCPGVLGPQHDGRAPITKEAVDDPGLFLVLVWKKFKATNV